MATQVDLLALLQAVDQRLREGEKTLGELEGHAAELSLIVETKRGGVERRRQEMAELEQKQRELEVQLAEEEVKIKEKRMRLYRIRNEKELNALQREIDLTKEHNAQIEEELLMILEEVDRQRSLLRKEEEEMALAERHASAEVTELRARAETIRQELVRDRTLRREMAASLDQELRRKYEMIFSRRGGMAVVEIRGGTCQGCYMNVPPQLFNELQKDREVILCPNCNRILYWHPAEEEVSDS